VSKKTLKDGLESLFGMPPPSVEQETAFMGDKVLPEGKKVRKTAQRKASDNRSRSGSSKSFTADLESLFQTVVKESVAEEKKKAARNEKRTLGTSHTDTGAPEKPRYLSYRMNQFVKTFKPNVVNLVLDFIDDDLNFDTLRYDGEKFIGKDQFRKSKIFTSNASFYKGEDYISGKIGEVPFEMCELKVRELSKVRDRYNYVFRGVFMRATMKRPVRGSILILPAAFKQYLTRTIKSFNRAGGRQLDESFLEFFKDIQLLLGIVQDFDGRSADDSQKLLS